LPRLILYRAMAKMAAVEQKLLLRMLNGFEYWA